MKHAAWIPFTLSSALVFGAADHCAPNPAANCNADTCCPRHCLGPTKYGVNAPVNPVTCNGDLVISIAGLYWNSRQTGLEYAINTEVDSSADRSSLISAEYKSPEFKWDFGFKLGLGYDTTCDGWDLGLVWTHYNGNGHSRNQSETSDQQTLLTLWADDTQNGGLGLPTIAFTIETNWDLGLDYLDLSLGRKYWNSRRVALRPHIGLRFASVDQNFSIDHIGGVTQDPSNRPIENDEVKLKNDFDGVGIRAGMDGTWTIGCGFAFYGDFALSLLNGRFDIRHDENKRGTDAPFEKTKVLETTDSCKATRLFSDLGLGLQYATLFNNCAYGLTVSLGFEQHLMLDMNQLWRVVPGYSSSSSFSYNIYHQRRGDLSVQGLTLKLVLDF